MVATADDDLAKRAYAQWILERTLHWIGAADAKVGTVVTIQTAMLGGLAAAFGIANPRSDWAMLTGSLAVILSVSAIFSCAMAMLPRLNGPLESNLFFGGIVKHAREDYVDILEKISPQAVFADLARQIHRNSEIARDKHRWVRRAMIWSFSSGVPWTLSVAFFLRG